MNTHLVPFTRCSDRHGDEYRLLKSEGEAVRHDPFSDWEARRQAIPDRVAAVVDKKMEKQYPKGTSLLIYVNLCTYDTWRAEIEDHLVKQTERAQEHFESIWAIWSDRLYQLWPRFIIATSQSV